jgi:hypothetical protein
LARKAIIYFTAPGVDPHTSTLPWYDRQISRCHTRPLSVRIRGSMAIETWRRSHAVDSNGRKIEEVDTRRKSGGLFCSAFEGA